MHTSFESLTIISPPSLQAYLMDIHHDTSLGSILEDDSISSTFKTCIHSCLGKGVGLWLIVRPSIYSFHIAHSTFTSALHFHLGFIQLLTSNIFICECGHGLDASGTHLVCCPFGGQWIATHDAIWNVMYALVQETGHTKWREWWYTLMLGVSLWTNLYMTRKDQIFVANMVVIDPTWETMASSVISQLANAITKLNAITKIYKYRGL